MKKVLFIRYKHKKGVSNGGDLGSDRSLCMLQHLYGANNVTIVSIHDDDHHTSLWEYLCGAWWFLFNYFWGLTPRRVRQIVQQASSYDIVFIDRTVFGRIAYALKRAHYNGQIISFFHNVEVIYFRAKLSHIPFKRIVLRCVDTNDRWTCLYSDKVLCLNPRDAKTLETLYHRHIDGLAPIAIKDCYHTPLVPNTLMRTKPLCLFIGSYFAPNNEGIEWFMKNVFPYVDITVQIIGKGMNALRSHYTIPLQAEVLSDVPDLRPYIEDADLMVLPIFDGSGMKIKTCEALMYGKYILGTREAFEGYEVDFTRVGACCNTPEEFIRAIQHYSTIHPQRFNTYSRDVYLRNHTESVSLENFKKVLPL